MTSSKGYTLDQLLKWSMEDHLIDGFEHREESLVIFAGDERHEFPFGEARAYLKRMFKPRGGPGRPAPRNES